MSAQDYIHSVVEHEIGDLLLRTADLADIFAAPMEAGNDNIRLQSLRRLNDRQNSLLVNLLIIRIVVTVKKIHAITVIFRQAHTAKALGHSDHSHTDAVQFQAGDLTVLLFLLGDIGTHRLHTIVLDNPLCPLQTGKAVINAEGIGGLKQIKARVVECCRQFVRIAAFCRTVGIPCKGSLKISNGQIGLGKAGVNIGELRHKIIGAIGLDGIAEHLVRQVDVADGIDGNHAVICRFVGGFHRLLPGSAGT